ncbi:MAG: phage terminase small subunit P27 family [Pirellulales bacterium]|nr:phage terminase small subunit P27 family [Pirellulales bacterium]
MATRGRKPNPSALNRLRGNPGKRATNKREPKIKAEIPPCPRHLDAEAKKEWRRVAGILQKHGLLTQVDRAVLVAYCRAWSLFVEADRHVRERGMTMVSPKTGAVYQSPYMNQLTAAMKDLVRFAAELGMTPSSRSRVKVDVDGPESDPMTRLLFERYGSTN